ncbi:MAG: 50S ribosomal protein L17 [Candidatus Lambdaproteobacteria bacterium RIFOXYD1_FULL_56_27]|uniref:Large ribosomal subunit protein bL17 n=1 Tax=Candidatus Lambdaproteobacteria bacterium RIFOXYD2_FULL_56_26 TaxID=1817773 RepID=A0A1F6GMQ0_9PROT|nr:MAG: 50S ribosomal protein L17 [Candidatus Lambdaproteobacteria bacterium RIFOXYD2_FULL_56_26]OGH05619.1 MAG: 50S ribosomal protein L17 [Candidatus Lambdaproteobacteria bacterium RIFOXYC1_FULL_56_13]OGH08579.1 MAG: 50S ribosomal protein L17 [Candidatus Lambdaproteobacteria bacterium RIFOXYD1_FULL_56_27]
MRHLKAGKRLGVVTSHRKAMIRNLVTSLLEHGQIRTTVTRAKEMRRMTDRMIGLAKRNLATEGGDLHAKRQAMAFLNNKEAYHKLFDQYGELFKDRNGGYTRIYKLGNRLGDNAQVALIQLVGLEGEAVAKKAAKSETIKEVKGELQASQKEAAPKKASTKKAKAETAEA